MKNRRRSLIRFPAISPHHIYKRNRAVDLGWRLFLFEADDVRARPDMVVGYITRAVASTSRVPVETLVRTN